MSTRSRTSRRDFLRTSAATTTALAALSVAAPAVLSAESPNERIGVGFIGTGVRGGSLVDIVTGNDKREPGRRVCPAIEGVRAVAACDVYKPHVDKAIFRGNNADAKACTPTAKSHAGLFDCVRSRKKPKCNEDQAFIEAVTFIMSYVSLREKRMVRWDREKEETVLDS